MIKRKRIEKIVDALVKDFALSDAETKAAKRAAKLSKADLLSNMVVEMTSLQGVMGKYYALQSGESKDVAEAIFEHYLPRNANDYTPKGKVGLVVGMADRLDSIVGLFAAGLAPTRNKRSVCITTRRVGSGAKPDYR